MVGSVYTRSNETVSRRLLFANLAMSFYNVGTVWLVQLSSYPLWGHVGLKEFQDYHIAWWHSIWIPVLFPAGLGFVGALAMVWFRPPGIPSWAVRLAVLLQIGWVAGTIVWWAPLMMKIGETPGIFPVSLYRLLLNTHWLRVALITTYSVLMFWMAIRDQRKPIPV